MRDILFAPRVYGRSPPGLPTKRLALQTLNYNLEKVVSYRRKLWRRVNGSHPLIRFLSSINIPLAMDDDRYVWAVRERALRVANSMRLTSIWGAGKTQEPGIFYGKGVTEAILVTANDIDIPTARRDWELLEPITVVTHPYNDFTLPFLDGSSEGVRGEGMAVIHIDATLLAFQYKRWYEVYAKDIEGDSIPGMNLFFQGWPLANALKSHLDITLFNRATARLLGKPLATQIDPNPFYLNFQPNYVDRLLIELAQYMETRRLGFDDWLSAMPLPSGLDYHDRLRMDDLPYVTQVEWLIFVSQMPALSFLLAFNDKTKSSANAIYISYIKHWVIRMLNGRLFGHGLTAEAEEHVLDVLQHQIEPYL